MAKIGRPQKPIDWKIFEELCYIQCTHEEIASVCHINRSTLYERAEKEYGEDFPTIYKRYSDGGKMSLRRTQMKLAQKNTAMAIWLGKQYLGQKDNQDLNQFDDKTLEHFQSLMKMIEKSQISVSNNAVSNINKAEKS